jgi:riboflavin transporter
MLSVQVRDVDLKRNIKYVQYYFASASLDFNYLSLVVSSRNRRLFIMLNIVTQIVAALVMILIFIITFRLDKTRLTSQNMSIITMLCLIAAILARVIAIKIPPSQPMFIIGVSNAVVIIIGILFAPKLAIIAGLLFDIMGVILSALVGDASLPFLGFTLTNVLMCLIPSLLVIQLKPLSKKQVAYLGSILLVLMDIIAIAYLLNTDKIKMNQHEIILSNNIKIIFVVLILLASIIMVIASYYTSKKVTNTTKLSVAHLALILLVTTIICSVILTSYWIVVMYQAPMIAGVLSRLIKLIITAPIELFIIAMIIKLIPMQYQKRIK